ncbi:MAG: SHOCT domain-containing protein [Desulfobacterales bacterium]|nr:MAG: SHOCT domain-containing protein [Desulfobacterales bacterium]
MDSTIVAALISAISSIIIAIIGRASAAGNTNKDSELAIPNRNKKIWMVSTIILVSWMGYAALFLHWDLAGMSVLLIPVVILIFSFAFPVKPTTAAATALFLFPLAFAAEPIGKWKRGMIFDNHFEPSVIGVYVSIAFGTAFIAWLINRQRSKSFRVSTLKDKKPQLNSSLAVQLSEMAKLHREGILSDEEFTKAKKKILSEKS